MSMLGRRSRGGARDGRDVSLGIRLQNAFSNSRSAPYREYFDYPRGGAL